MTVSFQGMDDPVVVNETLIPVGLNDEVLLLFMSDGTVRWEA